MPEIQVVSNVPLPVESKVPKLPLRLMEFGDSFLVGCRSKQDRATIRQRLSRFQYANFPVRFSVRAEGVDRVRVYRVEDYPYE